MEIVRVSSKGQLVIPAQLRKQLDIGPGTYIRIEEQDGYLQLTPLGDDIIEATYGMFRDSASGSATRELLKERAADLAREEAKIARWSRKPRRETKAPS